MTELFHEVEPEHDPNMPPQDLMAETHTLGGMMLNRDAIDDCLERVTGPEFYRPAHEAIFDAIAHMHLDGQRVDVVTVSDEMRRRGTLAKVGGQPYLNQIVSQVASPLSAGYYAEIVAQRATLRRVVAAGQKIQQLGQAIDGGNADDIVQAAQSEVDSIAVSKVSELRHAADDVDAVIASFDEPNVFFDTPWPSMNEVVVGLRAGRVYVVGARPGCGKSIMGLNFALWWMQRHGKSVAFSSLEMPREEVITRLLAQMSSVSFSKLQRGEMTDFERHQVNLASRTLKGLPRLWIDDRTTVEPAHVRQHARQAARRSDLGLVVIDYLGLMESSRPTENRQQEVARFSRAMKNLARTLDVPVVVLSQLNRGMENRGVESHPRLSDLRDSGAVEQDADVVLLLHRPDPNGDEVKVLIGKNRQGPRDAFALDFDGARMRMTEPGVPA